MPLNYRSGFNRLFVVAWVGWAISCLAICTVYSWDKRADIRTKYDQQIDTCRTILARSTATTEDQTIDKLRTLPPDKQKSYLAGLDNATKQRILSRLKDLAAEKNDGLDPEATATASANKDDHGKLTGTVVQVNSDGTAIVKLTDGRDVRVKAETLKKLSPATAPPAPTLDVNTCIDMNANERQAALAPYSYLYISVELLIAIVALPLLIYGMVIGFVRTIKWIREGFSTTPPS